MTTSNSCVQPPPLLSFFGWCPMHISMLFSLEFCYCCQNASSPPRSSITNICCCYPKVRRPKDGFHQLWIYRGFLPQLALYGWNPMYKCYKPTQELPSEPPIINCCCYKFRQTQEITCKILSDLLSNHFLSRFLYHTHCCGIWASWCLDASQINPFQAS